ncbi:MAG: ABC transporter ATP-binding protein [Bacteroidota bacterium]
MWNGPFLNEIFALARSNKRNIILIFFLSVLDSLLTLYFSVIIGEIVEKTLDYSLTSIDVYHVFFIICFWAFLTYWFNFLKLSENKKFTPRIQFIFTKFLVFVQETIDEKKDELTELLLTEVAKVQNVLLFGSQLALHSGIAILIIISYVFCISKLICLCIFLFLLLNIAFNFYINIRLEKSSEDLLVSRVEITSTLLEIIRVRKDLLQFNLQDRFLNVLRKNIKKMFLNVDDHSKYIALSRSLVKFFNYVFAIGVLVLLSTLEFEISTAITLIALIFFLRQPITHIHDYFKNLKTISPGLSRLNDFFRNQNKRVPIHHELQSNKDTKAILVDNVSFKINDKVILENLSHTFQKGINFIKGDSGSGKTTLCKIICHMITPQDGVVRFLSNKEHPLNIVLVNQNPIIFNDTIDKNIFVMNSAKLKVDFLQRHGHLYNTLAGKTLQANQLSGGQQQLVTILRALYLQPDILVLDEFSNNLSLEITQSIMHDLVKYRKNLITIIASHRLQEYKYDTILNLG